MSCLLVQCSEGFGFPEGAGQLREQGLLSWANLWHFHLPHVRVHASIIHIWSKFYMKNVNSSLVALRNRPSKKDGLLRTAVYGKMAEHDEADTTMEEISALTAH